VTEKQQDHEIRPKKNKKSMRTFRSDSLKSINS